MSIGFTRLARIAILASGSGSNAEAIMKWSETSKLATVVCVLSDKKKAPVLERAKNHQVPAFYVKKIRNSLREDYDRLLIEKLEAYSPDWIVLAGYMKLLSPFFLERYKNKVINIHPSLLPLFPGTDGYAEAFEARVQESGCTIHYVDEGVDTGKIIAQKKIPLNSNDTLEDFRSRGLQIENKFYPEVLEQIITGKL